MSKNKFAESLPKIVKSAARVLDIIELLVGYPEGLTLSELKENLEIPLSSLHDLLSTMVIKGFVLRDKQLRYMLGPKISSVVSSYSIDSDIVLIANPLMDQLRDKTGESNSLTVLVRNHIIFIHKKVAKGIVKIINPTGTRIPAHATGSGKILLAFLPEPELDQIFPEDELQSLTPNSISSKRELKRELKKIKKAGYAYDEEESEVGVWAVACCIRDKQGEPVASLSVVAPTFHVTNKKKEQWRDDVIDTAKKISSGLGFQG